MDLITCQSNHTSEVIDANNPTSKAFDADKEQAKNDDLLWAQQ